MPQFNFHFPPPVFQVPITFSYFNSPNPFHQILKFLSPSFFRISYKELSSKNFCNSRNNLTWGDWKPDSLWKILKVECIPNCINVAHFPSHYIYHLEWFEGYWIFSIIKEIVGPKKNAKLKKFPFLIFTTKPICILYFHVFVLIFFKKSSNIGIVHWYVFISVQQVEFYKEFFFWF